MKKVLVTGATGFVGANIVRRLLKEGYDVHILTRKESNLWRLHDIYSQLHDTKIDLKDFNKLKEVVENIQPDYIIHLAIYGGRPGQTDEKSILNSNLIGTINLVEACSSIKYKCFINTGSSSEYGKKSTPMNEDDLCNPNSMYGVTKASATMYCRFKALSDGKNIGTLRLFSPFGDYEDAGRLIPDLIVGSLINGKVKLGNPDAVRDFIYIDDVCDIYLKVLQKPELLKGEVFNIGYGQQHSVKYMAEAVKNIISDDIILEYNSNDGRKADTEFWVSDIDKIKKAYDWSPNYDIKDALKKSICWFNQNIELYKNGY